MALKEEVGKVLRARFPDSRVELEQAPGRKVGGYIVSNVFEGMSQVDRQNMLWDFLDRELEESTRRRIIAILTLTPAEAGVAA